MKTSVVIPNYNGEELLRKNLPSVLAIGADEIIVVDDGSTDKSITGITSITGTTRIKIIKHNKNLGFAKTVNDGVAAATGDVLVLLNTDVVPQKDLLSHALPHFKNPEVFAVSFNEGKYGYARGIFYRGLIEFRGEKADYRVHESFWASGGSAAFDRKKWNELGGLDTIYSPFYWEDTDISYRAQMRGWKILWEPKAKVSHEHQATTKKSWTKKRVWVVERNQLIFFWKNISSPRLWLFHLLWLPVRLLPLGRIVPFFLATLKLPQILMRRIGQVGKRKVGDEEILAKFHS